MTELALYFDVAPGVYGAVMVEGMLYKGDPVELLD